MGLFTSKNTMKQVMLVGPEGSGKTTLLYQMILRKKEWKATPTIGFNYEEVTTERGEKAGFWDIGGSQSSSLLTPAVYKNVHFSALIYVICIDLPDQLTQARKQLHRLLSEDELRHITHLGIVFNYRTSGYKA